MNVDALSPYNYNNGNANVFLVNSDGWIDNNNVDWTDPGVRQYPFKLRIFG